jgi:AcrR family transcriptional regulator
VTETAPAPPEVSRRGALTVDEIVDVALAMVRRNGIGALTMRRLADDLGVTPMAVYHHLPSKTELLRRVVERVGAELRMPHDGRPWTEQVRDYALRWRDELHAHPGVAGYLLTQDGPPATAMRVIDDAVGLLMESGFAERDAARAYAALASFVLARVDLEESLARNHRPADDPAPLPALPGGHEVNIERVMGYVRELSDDDHFAYTLDRLLDGIEATRPQG